MDNDDVVIVGVDFETAKREARWGTNGLSGQEPTRWIRLADADTDHLQAILRTMPQVRDAAYERIIHAILKDRGVEPEQFSIRAHKEWENKTNSRLTTYWPEGVK